MPVTVIIVSHFRGAVQHCHRNSRKQDAIERIVGIVKERARPAIAALGDKVWVTWDDDASKTGHTAS